MKKIFFIIPVFIFSILHVSAQNDAVTKAIDVFPFQHATEANAALSTMESWDKTNWKSLFIMLDDDSLKLKSTYALNAYVNHVANDLPKRKTTATFLVNGLASAKTFYAKQC